MIPEDAIIIRYGEVPSMKASQRFASMLKGIIEIGRQHERIHAIVPAGAGRAAGDADGLGAADTRVREAA